MTTKIFITREIDIAGVDLLRQHFDVDIWEKYEAPPKETLINRAKKAHGMVSLLSDKLDADFFKAVPNIKIIAQYAVGFDNIDISKANEQRVCVTNTPDVLTESSADFAWAQLMAVSRRVVEADKYVRAGDWKVAWHPSMMLGADFFGSTIGIIGAGRIGQAVGRRAKGFNMRVLYTANSNKTQFETETGAQKVDLDTLLKESDFVSLHVPLTSDTKLLINSQKLKLMKPTAYLVNNSRGPVIDETALYEALKTKQIAGAALDVFATEPTSQNNHLLTLDNIVVAPHISSASNMTRKKMSVMVAENIITYFNKKQPPNLINQYFPLTSP